MPSGVRLTTNGWSADTSWPTHMWATYISKWDPADHPLTVDLPNRFAYTSEQYYMHIDPGVNVLLETEYDLGTGTVAMPVAWTKRWGSGARLLLGTWPRAR